MKGNSKNTSTSVSLTMLKPLTVWISTDWKILAATAAKSFQLCLTLCDPIDGSPPDSPFPGCREPAQEIPPMTRSCGRELLSKASGLKGLPRLSQASTPKPESVCLIVLCPSPMLLTLTGGYP